MQKYLVIDRLEDETSIHIFDKNELLRMLNDGDFGPVNFTTTESLPSDLMEFPANTMLVFKGNAVVPKPVEKVKAYELP